MNLFSPGHVLEIGGLKYLVSAHPEDASRPYLKKGQQSIVYQLSNESGEFFALKVFVEKYRNSLNVDMADELASFSHMQGLRSCQRTVLNFSQHGLLIKQHPELTFGVLLPWFSDTTWAETMQKRSPIHLKIVLHAARFLAQALAAMEQKGLAHCDLRGENYLVLPDFTGELIDLEAIFNQGYPTPDPLPVPVGYAHKTTLQGLWNAQADRFSGAVLIAEILGWADNTIPAIAHGNTFFDPGELQNPQSQRFLHLVKVIEKSFGAKLAHLFENTWASNALENCPPLAEWSAILSTSEVIENLPVTDTIKEKDQQPVTDKTIQDGEILPSNQPAESTNMPIKENETAEEVNEPVHIEESSLDENAPSEAIGMDLELNEQAASLSPAESTDSAILDELDVLFPSQTEKKETPPASKENVQNNSSTTPQTEALQIENSQENVSQADLKEPLPSSEVLSSDVKKNLAEWAQKQQSKDSLEHNASLFENLKNESPTLLIASIVLVVLCVVSVGAASWFNFLHKATVTETPASNLITPVLQVQSPVPTFSIMVFNDISEFESAAYLEDIEADKQTASPGTIQKSIEIPANTALGVRLGWCAINEEMLQDAYNNIGFELFVDNWPINTTDLTPFVFEKDGVLCAYYAGAIMDWQPGSHSLVKTYQLNKPLHFGTTPWLQGNYRYEFSISVK